MTLPRFLARTLMLAAMCLGPSIAHADFKLDPRFTDANGDMVADAPTDPSKQIDPDTLIFSYTPVEDPAVYAKVWQEFTDHLAKVTGKKVQFFPVQSNAAQLEAMRAGRLHVAGFNTGSNPIAVACSGFVPFAMMASKDGAYGYEMEIITYPGSGITKVEDIKGKKMAFTSETSNSGYKAPSALLRSQFGMEAGKDYEPAFSGKHDNSIIGVANKDYPAGYGYAYNLKPELAAKVKEAFFSFNWDGTALLKEFQSAEPPQEKFIPITFKETWAVVRQVDDAMGVSYACK